MSPASPPAEPAQPRRRHATTRSSFGGGGTKGSWLVVFLLLAVAIVVPLLVGTYDSETPRLGGIPFFFWYQFLLVPIVALMTFTAFRLSMSATARDREARGLEGRPDQGVDAS